MAFSIDKTNLYQSESINDAESLYKEKRDRVLDNIISEGMATQNPGARESCRIKLRDKIKDGFIDREYLSKHGWSEDRILITSEIIDFLIPQIMPSFAEEKVKPNIKQIREVILPTENGQGPETGSGTGMAEKRLIPRFELLVNFLKENKIAEDNYFCYRGKNSDGMMRRESYVMFVIPDLKKLVLICDEEGNATYIIHNAPTKDEFEKLKRDEEVAESERSPSFYYKMTKDDLQILMKELGIVSSIKWDEEKWLEKVEDELTKEVNFNFKMEDTKQILELEDDQLKEMGNAEPAPPGWMTSWALAKQFGLNFKAVKQAVKKYLETNKDWSKMYKDSAGIARWHYSPKLVELITEELGKYESAPPGWMTNGRLAKQLDVSFWTVKRIAERNLETNKDWRKQFKGERNRPDWYYSPELVEKIKQDILELKVNDKSKA